MVQFSYSVTDDLNANYLVSDFYKPSVNNVPGIGGQPHQASVVAFDPSLWTGFPSLQQHWIVLHEMGHSLGLADANDAALGALGSTKYTVMSYNIATNGYSSTLMALDVALLHEKYGAPTSVNAGATTYTLSTSGLDRDGSDGAAQNGGTYVCIVDTGGDDIIDYTGGSKVILNLNAATISSGSVATNLQDIITALGQLNAWTQLDSTTRDEITNSSAHAGGFFSSLLNGSGDRVNGGFSIARNSEIERAYGGSDKDVLVGSVTDNILWGRGDNDAAVDGAGLDYVFGGDGNDEVRLVADTSRDAVVGGAGNDTLTGSTASDDGDIIFGGETNQLNTAPDNATELKSYLEKLNTLVGTIGGKQPTGYAQASNDGADSVSGGKGADSLSGGKGNDTVLGQDGDDVVLGDDGNDSLTGESGKDVLFGGSGQDRLQGGDDADLLVDGDGSNTLEGGAGADKLVVSVGENTVSGGQGDDFIDIYDLQAGAEVRIVLNPGDGHEWVRYGEGTARVEIYAPSATLSQIEIVLDGSTRVTTHYGGSPLPEDEDPERWSYESDAYLKIGSDTVFLGKAAWTKFEDFDGSVLVDEISEFLNFITVVTSNGSITLTDWLDDEDNRQSVAVNGFQASYDDGREAYDEASGKGSAGNDSVAGGSGTDDLAGGGGADTLSAGDGDDAVSGGSGDDVLTGGAGSDLVQGGAGDDLALFDGVQGDYAFARRADGALVVSHTSSGAVDVLFDVEALKFGATTVSASALTPYAGTRARDEITSSLGGGDEIFGFGGGDVITLRGSDNTVDGGEGEDVVVLSGDLEDYTFLREEDGSVAVSNGFDQDHLLKNVEFLRFGSDPGLVSIRSLVGDTGTNEDDVLNGTAGNDRLLGLSGSDVIYGGEGDDTIDGGAGVDIAQYDGAEDDYTITSSGGAWTVSGGDGVDHLQNVEVIEFFGSGTALVPGAAGGLVGTSAGDVLSGTGTTDIISGGTGSDTIGGGDGEDLLVLAGAQDDYSFSRDESGAYLIVHDASGDTDVVTDVERVWFSGDHVIAMLESLVEGDGSPGDDFLSGGEDDDELHGFGGDDRLYGGDGDDLLDGGTGVDTAIFSGEPGDYTVSSVGGGLQVSGPDGADTLSGVEIILFEGDGSALVPGAAGGLIGTSGADTLTGTSASDIISPLAGADVVDGGAGSDLLVLAGDAEDYAFLWNADRTIDVRHAGGVIDRIANIEQVWFDGGGAIQYVEGLAGEIGGAEDDSLFGREGAERLYGFGGNDEFHASDGDDTLVGAAGIDTVRYGGGFADYTVTTNPDGSLSVVGPDGNDRLEGIEVITFADDETALFPGAAAGLVGTAGGDTLAGGDGPDLISPAAGDDVVNGGDGDDILILNGASEDYRFVRQADGDVEAHLIGGAEVDVFRNIERVGFAGDHRLLQLPDLVADYGTAGNDVLIGTPGDDELYGLAGDDDFLGQFGTDNIYGGDGIDLFDAEAAQDNFTINTSGNVTTLTANFTDTTLTNVEVIYFSTEGRGLLLVGPTLSGAGSGDTLTGTSHRDIIDPGSGDDTVNGGGGSDILVLQDGTGSYAFSDEGDGWFKATNLIDNDEVLFRNIEYIYFAGSHSMFEPGALI